MPRDWQLFQDGCWLPPSLLYEGKERGVPNASQVVLSMKQAYEFKICLRLAWRSVEHLAINILACDCANAREVVSILEVKDGKIYVTRGKIYVTRGLIRCSSLYVFYSTCIFCQTWQNRQRFKTCLSYREVQETPLCTHIPIWAVFYYGDTYFSDRKVVLTFRIFFCIKTNVTLTACTHGVAGPRIYRFRSE